MKQVGKIEDAMDDKEHDGGAPCCPHTLALNHETKEEQSDSINGHGGKKYSGVEKKKKRVKKGPKVAAPSWPGYGSRKRYARRMVPDENGNQVYLESEMCHQCQRNDRGRVVRCGRCTTKRYCVRCMTRWYPSMTEEMFAQRCPVCLDNCNCKRCLRDVCTEDKEKIDSKSNDDQKVRYSVFILCVLSPFLKLLNEEHIREKAIESKVQGCSLSDLHVEKAKCSSDERMYCNCCHTSIFDLHRSCPRCRYDLCLGCCRELREGNLQGNKEGVTTTFIDPGPDYLHGGKDKQGSIKKGSKFCYVKKKQTHGWKSLEDGRIPCPPKSMGGCGKNILDLMRIKEVDRVSKLVENTETLIKMHKPEGHRRDMPEKRCTCSDNMNGSDQQLVKRCFPGRFL